MPRGGAASRRECAVHEAVYLEPLIVLVLSDTLAVLTVGLRVWFPASKHGSVLPALTAVFRTGVSLPHHLDFRRWLVSCMCFHCICRSFVSLLPE